MSRQAPGGTGPARGLSFAGRGVLLDVEGTTSSVAFVADVLFPYARQRLRSYLTAHRGDPAVADAVAAMRRDANDDRLTLDDVDAVVRQAEAWIDADAKLTGLKALQGLIWRDGYEGGELKAHVYPDVPANLAKWHAAGLDVRIYSSGSVLAQQLFFRHTEGGDLTVHLSGHYDTTTGPKREPASYAAIAAAFGRPAAELLFLSDVVAELDAARAAGWRTGLAVRPGNTPTPDNDHPRVETFDHVRLWTDVDD